MDEEIKSTATETAEEAVAAVEAVGEAPEKDEAGNVRISVEVVSTIAGIATNEVNGVAGMYGTFAGGIAEMLGAKKSPSKGVKVDMEGNTASIDLYIVVEYGVRIPELAWEIQENVKNSVETMTGLDVQKVNIHIEGVSFDKDEDKENAPEPVEETADDADEEITD